MIRAARTLPNAYFRNRRETLLFWYIRRPPRYLASVSCRQQWEIPAILINWKPMGAIKRFIFWDFPRGSWQYDVMVGLILAFFFVPPKTFFPHPPKTAKFAN